MQPVPKKPRSQNVCDVARKALGGAEFSVQDHLGVRHAHACIAPICPGWCLVGHAWQHTSRSCSFRRSPSDMGGDLRARLFGGEAELVSGDGRPQPLLASRRIPAPARHRVLAFLHHVEPRRD